MEFDEKKWADIMKQWEEADQDQASSVADTKELKDPASWTESDNKLRLRGAFDKAGINPETPDDAPPDVSDGAKQLAREASKAAAPMSLAPRDAESPEVRREVQQKFGPPTARAIDRAPSAQPQKSSGPDWEALAENLRQAHSSAALSRGAENMFANVSTGNYHTDPGRFDEQVKQAEVPLEMAKAKQAYEHTQMQTDAAKQTAALAHAEKDPNSEVSKRSREAFKAFFGNSNMLPPNVDQLSAADIKQFTSGDMLPLMKMKSTENIAAEKAKGAADSIEAQKGWIKSQYRTGDAKADAALDAEIEALRDQQGINTFVGVHKQKDSEKETANRQQEGFKHAEDMQKGQQAFEMFKENWRREHPEEKTMGAETIKEIATSKTASDQLALFEKYLNNNRTVAAQFGGWASKHGLGDITSALDVPGSDFAGFRKATIAELVKQIDNTAARAQAIEQLDSVLPQLTDSPGQQAAKMGHVKALVENNFKNLENTARAAGYRVPPREGSQQPPTETVNMRFPDGKTKVVPAADVEKWKKLGGTVTNG